MRDTDACIVCSMQSTLDATVNFAALQAHLGGLPVVLAVIVSTVILTRVVARLDRALSARLQHRAYRGRAFGSSSLRRSVRHLMRSVR